MSREVLARMVFLPKPLLPNLGQGKVQVVLTADYFPGRVVPCFKAEQWCPVFGESVDSVATRTEIS